MPIGISALVSDSVIPLAVIVLQSPPLRFEPSRLDAVRIYASGCFHMVPCASELSLLVFLDGSGLTW